MGDHKRREATAEKLRDASREYAARMATFLAGMPGERPSGKAQLFAQCELVGLMMAQVVVQGPPNLATREGKTYLFQLVIDEISRNAQIYEDHIRKSGATVAAAYDQHEATRKAQEAVPATPAAPADPNLAMKPVAIKDLAPGNHSLTDFDPSKLKPS